MVSSKNKAGNILKILKKTYPGVDCALAHETPLQLMVSTILSAQCTDKRVNEVTPALFAKYRTAQDFARARTPDLEKLIRSTGFFRQKARWIKASGEKLVKNFGGKVPRKMEDLLKLPGVARKTANVVLGGSNGGSAAGAAGEASMTMGMGPSLGSKLRSA